MAAEPSARPKHLALFDAQFVSMMSEFITEDPDAGAMPVPFVLLFLKDTFPM